MQSSKYAKCNEADLIPESDNFLLALFYLATLMVFLL